jgi:hypothetical protein
VLQGDADFNQITENFMSAGTMKIGWGIIMILVGGGLAAAGRRASGTTSDATHRSIPVRLSGIPGGGLPDGDAKRLSTAERIVRRFVIGFAIVAIVLAVPFFLVVLGTHPWMKWTKSPASSDTQPPAAQTPQASAPAPPASAAPPPVTPPSVATSSPARATPPPPAARDPKASAAGAAPATALSPESPPPVPVTQQQDPLTFEFEVTSSSFVEIAADGKVTFSKAMEPGDRQRIQAARELRVKVGDAGAFVWSLNGKPARMLGEAGVARSARITRSNFKRYLQ